MQKVGIIGYGAVAGHVCRAARHHDFRIGAIVARAGRSDAARALAGDACVVTDVVDLPDDLSVVVDCAGHGGLRSHGARVLNLGLPLITVSVGALADRDLFEALGDAASRSGSRLHLATGAIGALDALSAAATGRLDSVSYTGRKPPDGWRGSLAEDVLDLDALAVPETHFEGSARDCALRYPKNANVAASVALAGLGLDATRARLIADPGIERNIHEISATGDFGTLRFSIEGKGLPDNPKSSALTAMSVVRAIVNRDAALVIG